MNTTTKSAFNPMAAFGATFTPVVMIFGTGVRATEPSLIGSNEGLAIPEFGPIDFNILKTHL